ncbi:Thioesterase domain containing protein [Quillaja saponaria]|uniref:Thioesterase domain containing protein n=1 Tax=Quillaja saponaria TaxID=32244 RepID=A0AAD7PDH1_QUISA|nr:Thioesterase domain containing protein [Quillaja saponaria]
MSNCQWPVAFGLIDIQLSVAYLLQPLFPTTMEILKDIDPELVSNTLTFLEGVGMSNPVPDNCNTSDFYSDFIRSFLKLHEVNEVESFAPFSSNSLLLYVTTVRSLLSSFCSVLDYLIGSYEKLGWGYNL